MSKQDFLHSHWSRRSLLRAGAATTAAGLFPWRALAAIPDQFDGSKFQLAAPEPNPKRGGTLRYGITMRPPHFDVHQSGTINNLGAQGCMFDNLIRHDPRDGGRLSSPTSRIVGRLPRTVRPTRSTCAKACSSTMVRS